MNFSTHFAHAGHVHEEAASGGVSMLVLFVGIAGLASIAVLVLVILNRRKVAARGSDKPEKS